MNKKIIIIAAILLSIALFSFIAKDRDFSGPADGKSGSCESAPSEYKSLCDQINAWLDQKLAEWKPAEYKPMDFAAYHTLASFPNVRNTDLDLLQEYTRGLEESGADTIVVYMDGTPFLKNDKMIISKWDAVVAKIKSDGKKLYVAYIPDVKGSDLKNWETYKSVETSAIREIIKKYSPDSFAVLNEPSTIERELSFKPTAEQWAALASDSADLVRNLDSKTKINIQITGDDLPYFGSLINARNISGVGFNIYGFRAFDTFTPYIASAKNAGKNPMLSETWKMFKDNQKYDGMDSLDAKWVRVAAYYAQTNGMSYMNPFFTFYFFVSPADVRNQLAFLSKLETNLANGNRTKSFLDYQSVISEIKAVPKNGNHISTPKPTTTSNSTATPAPNNGNPCGSAPSQYKPQCEQLNSWLDQKIAAWKPAEYKPMDFAVYDLLSSDDMFVKMNAASDTKFLNAIEGANADIVVLYIRPNEYFSQKARYDSLINKIRTDGKKLFIGARFGDEPMTFAQYGEELDKYARDIIAAIKPDYFGIVMEPATMEKKHGFSATDEQWRDLADKTAGLSKQLSPATKTVADGHKEELNFLRLASDLNNMDVIGFNIYDSTGIYDEYSGYLGKGDVVGKTIDYANSKGKKTWILETWVTDCSSSPEKKKACTSSFMQTIDAKWIRTMSHYAQKHSMDAITPFFTGKFVYYGESQSEFDSAINNGEKTPVFYEYKSIIEEIKNNAK